MDESFRSASDGCKPTLSGLSPPPTREYSIAAVDRALDMLEALARIGPATLAELASEAQCTRTAGFRLLRTLQARGFAIQDNARGMWRLGALWATLSRASTEQSALAATAAPRIEALARLTGETVHLRVRDGTECEIVGEFRPAEFLRRFSKVGDKLPLHAGPGRLLLAHAPEAVQAQILSQQRLPRFTPATMTDPRRIAADLPRVRERGSLITIDEVVVGATAISAPVRDARGQVIAILVLVASSLRMRPPRPKSLVKPVMEAADELSAALGYRPKPASQKKPPGH